HTRLVSDWSSDVCSSDLVLAVLLTSAVAPLVGLPAAIGAIVGGSAMAGDLLSSFVKRRLALVPSSKATGLDQVPESLLPLLACQIGRASCRERSVGCVGA